MCTHKGAYFSGFLCVCASMTQNAVSFGTGNSVEVRLTARAAVALEGRRTRRGRPLDRVTLRGPKVEAEAEAADAHRSTPRLRMRSTRSSIFNPLPVYEGSFPEGSRSPRLRTRHATPVGQAHRQVPGQEKCSPFVCVKFTALFHGQVIF